MLHNDSSEVDDSKHFIQLVAMIQQKATEEIGCPEDQQLPLPFSQDIKHK